MESSPDEIFKQFLSEIKNSDDKQLNKIHSLIERDRFGLDCFDREIQTQIEVGNYGAYTRHVWHSFNEEHMQGSAKA